MREAVAENPQTGHSNTPAPICNLNAGEGEDKGGKGRGQERQKGMHGSMDGWMHCTLIPCYRACPGSRVLLLVWPVLGGGGGIRAKKTLTYLKWASDFWLSIQNFIFR